MALCARRISSLGDTKWATPTLAILMLSASFFCGIPTLLENAGGQAPLPSSLSNLDRTTLPSLSLFLGSAFGGIGFCLFLLLWAETLSRMSLAKIALFTALPQVFAVVLVYFCQGFDQTRFFLALFLLPAIAVLALTHAWNRIKAQDEHTIAPYNKSWSSLPWKLILLTAILCFTYGLRSHQLAEGAGMHSSVSTAMAMAVFAGFVYFLSDRISLNALVKSALPLTLCGFLLIPSEGFLGTVVSSYMISAGYSFMTLLIALMLYDISKRFGIMVLLLFCLKNAVRPPFFEASAQPSRGRNPSPLCTRIERPANRARAVHSRRNPEDTHAPHLRKARHLKSQRALCASWREIALKPAMRGAFAHSARRRT